MTLPLALTVTAAVLAYLIAWMRGAHTEDTNERDQNTATNEGMPEYLGRWPFTNEE